MSEPRPPEHPHDPSTDSTAVELQDRDLTSTTAPPGGHSGGSNTGNSHREEETGANVTKTTGTAANVTTANISAGNEEEASEGGSGNAEPRVSGLEETKQIKLIRLLSLQMSARHYLALLALACTWIGAQVPLFLFGTKTDAPIPDTIR